MAIAIIDPGKNVLQFAGANIPMYLIREKTQTGKVEKDLILSLENDDYQLYKILSDKQPLGVHWEETDFTSHMIKLRERDSIYIFSDGYVDQYGGKKRKKFKSKRLMKLLLSLQDGSMDIQRKLIEDAFERWRGIHEQIDDVCAFGFRI
jgi:serine phosphatase RsbU (regulator of sigma subunit)